MTTSSPNPPPNTEDYPSADAYRMAHHAWVDSLDDGDFWHWVLNHRYPGQDLLEEMAEVTLYDPGDPLAPLPTPSPYGDDLDPEDSPSSLGSPCEVCGATMGPCGYDSEGRAYVHTTPVTTTLDDDGEPIPVWYHQPPTDRPSPEYLIQMRAYTWGLPPLGDPFT